MELDWALGGLCLEIGRDATETKTSRLRHFFGMNVVVDNGGDNGQSMGASTLIAYLWRYTGEVRPPDGTIEAVLTTAIS